MNRGVSRVWNRVGQGIRGLLGVLVAVGGFGGGASAATRTWTGSAASGVWNTAGNWAENTVPVNYDTLYMPLSVELSQSQTIGNPLSVGHLHLWPGLGAWSLSGNKIEFNDNTGSSQAQLFHNSANPVTFSGTVDINDGGMATRWWGFGTGKVTLSAALGGSQRLWLWGRYPVELTAANGYNGNGTFTVGGGQLILSGNGTLNSMQDWNLAGGAEVVITNTPSSTLERLPNSNGSRVYGGGTIRFTHAGGAANYLETIGTLTLNPGHFRSYTSRASSSQTSRFSVGGISRNNGASAFFSGNNLGVDTRNEFYLTSAPTLQNSVLPWAIIYREDLAAYDFATHGGNNTSIARYNSYGTGSETTWTATSINARPSADQTLSNNRSLNTLTLDSGIDLLGPGADRNISMNSPGAILQSGGTSVIGVSSGNGYQFGGSGSEMILHIHGTLDVTKRNSAVPFPVGGGRFIKAGPGTLILRGGEGTDANGEMFLNEGTVRITHQNGLSNNGGLQARFVGGRLEIASDSNLTSQNYYNSWRLMGDYEFVVDRATSGAGPITHTFTLGSGDSLMADANSSWNIGGTHTLTVSRGSLITSDTGHLVFTSRLKMPGNSGAFPILHVNTNAILSFAGLEFGNDPNQHVAKKGPGVLRLTGSASGVTGSSPYNSLHLFGGQLITTVNDALNQSDNGMLLRLFPIEDSWATLDLTNTTQKIRREVLEIAGAANSVANITGSGGTLTLVPSGGTALFTVEGGQGPAGATIRGGTLNLNNNTLQLNIGDSANADVELSIDSIVASSSGTGLIKTNAGAVALSGISTYTGPTTVRQGTLLAGTNAPVSASGAFGSASSTIALGDSSSLSAGHMALGITGPWTITRTVTVNNNNANGRTTLGGYSAHASTFAGAVTLNRNVFLTAVSGGTSTFSANISGSAGVTKVGAGTVVYSGTDKGYTGPTIISNGTLRVNNTLASAVTVASGGTLGGTGRANGGVTVTSGGTVAPGASIGVLTNSTLDLQSGSILDLEFNGGGTAHDQLAVTSGGGLTLNGGTVNLYDEGTVDDWTPVNGTYNLIQYTGGIGGAGVSALSVNNPDVSKSYVFGTAGGWVTLTIADAGTTTTSTTTSTSTSTDSSTTSTTTTTTTTTTSTSTSTTTSTTSTSSTAPTMTWLGGTSGNWTAGANWSRGSGPAQFVDETAIYNANTLINANLTSQTANEFNLQIAFLIGELTAPQGGTPITVNVPNPLKVKGITMASDANWDLRLTGSGNVTWDGNQTWSIPEDRTVTIDANLVSSAGTLTIGGGSVSGGKVMLTGTRSAFVGTRPLVLADGTLDIGVNYNLLQLDASTIGATSGGSTATVMGEGRIDAHLTVIGAGPGYTVGHIAPGANPAGQLYGDIGTLTFGDNKTLTLQDGVVLHLDLGTPGANASSPGNADYLPANNTLTLPVGGTVTVDLYDNANANGQGSIGAGWYRVAASLNFGSLNNFAAGDGVGSGTFRIGLTPLSGVSYAFSQVNNSGDKFVMLEIATTTTTSTSSTSTTSTTTTTTTTTTTSSSTSTSSSTTTTTASTTTTTTTTTTSATSSTSTTSTSSTTTAGLIAANWPYRVPITFPGSAAVAPLTNFPAVVKLGAHVAGFSYAQFQSGSGGDLRFVNQDMTEVLTHEIERWDTAGTSYVWVRLPTLTATTQIWALWGNPSAVTHPAYTTNGTVWAEGFTGVYHLADSALALDSTVNRNDGTSTANTNLVSQLGLGQGFNGTSARIDLDHYARPPTMSIQAWVRSPGHAGSAREIVGWADAFHVAEFRIDMDAGVEGRLSYLEYDGTFNRVASPIAIDNNQRWHVVVTKDASGQTVLYTNGVEAASANFGVMNPATTALALGVMPKSTADWYHNGELDEVQISTVVRSPAWVLGSYLNQGPHTNFVSYGPVHTPATVLYFR